MTANWEKIEKNLGVLTVEVAADRVDAALDKAFKKVVAKVSVPGFRKGKVPRGMFEKRFGVESLYQDALDILLPEAYMEAVAEAGIIPVDRPEIDIEQVGKGQELKFTAKVTVKPEVQLGEYKGIEIPAQSLEVTEEDIENELKQLQQRHAELVVVEEGAVENGDTVVIDFEGFLDGVPFDGGKAEKYSLEIGSGSFIPGFEEQLVGLAKGEEKDIDVTFPENYHSEELKGKPVVFKIKLHDIKRKNLPALDDEFAKDVSEFDTLDEYKQDIAKRIAERKEQNGKREKENAVVEKAAAAAEVEIPEAMIRDEVERMLSDFENRLKMQGMTLEMYFQFSGQNEADLKDQMKGDAEKRVLQSLVLEAIAKAEGIEASDEELEEELSNLAKQYQREVDELRAILTANGSLESLKSDLVTRKTVQYLVDNSKTEATVA
ncbi:trigger factor [Paenibacillus sp. YN15]|uniref:trigger factor n=1 Tax=Paenibacillus sp. YN15 TaxID=1742774 RepID=UPI000DCC297F|nr:trigger factor [Paenibacillus sp. YN15]RAV06338.1 trigger factor [Paenibacillus sp. YN15]